MPDKINYLCRDFLYVNEPDTTWKLMPVWALVLLIGILSQLLELLCQKFLCAVLFNNYIYSFFTRFWVHRSVFKTSRTHLNTLLLPLSYAEFSSSNTVWGLTGEHWPRFLFFLVWRRKKSHFRFRGHSAEADFSLLADLFSRCKAAIILCANTLEPLRACFRNSFFPARCLLLCWFLWVRRMNERG